VSSARWSYYFCRGTAMLCPLRRIQQLNEAEEIVEAPARAAQHRQGLMLATVWCALQRPDHIAMSLYCSFLKMP